MSRIISWRGCNEVGKKEQEQKQKGGGKGKKKGKKENRIPTAG